MVHLTTILENAETFDILLFNGQNYWFSYIVELFTGSKFSHIGIILKAPTYLDPELTGTYLLESGIEPTPDPEDKKKKFGVQLTELTSLIHRYTGKIYYRKLNAPVFTNNPTLFYRRLRKIHSVIEDKPYDDNAWDLLRADLRIRLGNCQKTSEFFCSALVGFVYAQLGLLDKDILWDLLQPKDFANQTINQMLGSKGHFGPLTRIK